MSGLQETIDRLVVACDALVHGALGIFRHTIAGVLGGTKRVSWVYLLASATVAAVVLVIRRWRANEHGLPGLLRQLVPADIYLHRSSFQDYLWFFLSPLVHVPLIGTITWVSPAISAWVANHLVAVLGPNWRWQPGSGGRVASAFASVLAIDLGNYVSHWLMHKVPALWEFHKTHHSAEVLNPLTADRLHPLERWLIELCVGIASGVVLGVLAYVYWPHITYAKLLGINCFIFLTNVISGNLRHSHVWFSYGPVLERVFSSPAQHQIHHSRHPDHLDKNLATHFALWDWLFGTLYPAPVAPLRLDLGLADGSENLYRNPWALFAQPFRANWRRLRAAVWG